VTEPQIASGFRPVNSEDLLEQISSTELLEGELRLDASYYSAEVIAARETVERASDQIIGLGAFSRATWYPSRFRRVWAAPDVGVPLIGSTELFHLRPESEKFLSRTQTREIDRLKVEPTDLLITRSGSVGRATVAGERLRDMAVSEHVIRVELHPDSLWGFLCAFLLSPIGKSLLLRGRFGANVPELEPHHVDAVPIPCFPGKEEAIHHLIMEAVETRDAAAALIDESNEALLEALELPPFELEEAVFLPKPARSPTHTANPHAFDVSSDDLHDRLDGSFHVPIARAALTALAGCGAKLKRLVELTEEIYVAPRFARIYVTEARGVPFLQGRSIPQYRPIDLQYISRRHTKKLSRWIIQQDTVLVTCSGTIGRVALSTGTEDGWAASQHIMRVRVEKGRSDAGYLAAFLRNPYGQHQLKAKIYGGVVDELTERDAAAIQIPDLPAQKQQRIGDLVREAYRKRDVANSLEDQGITAVAGLLA
jgi:type I restriction enzyme, S subunit